MNSTLTMDPVFFILVQGAYLCFLACHIGIMAWETKRIRIFIGRTAVDLGIIFIALMLPQADEADFAIGAGAIILIARGFSNWRIPLTATTSEKKIILGIFDILFMMIVQLVVLALIR